MGTFAWITSADDKVSVETNEEEFKKRLECLFKTAGMMSMDFIRIKGQTVALTVPAAFNEKGNINACYNWFDDEYNENAGYNSDGHYIYSGKLSSKCFSRAVLSALTLESNYLPEMNMVNYNGDFVALPVYTGWLNYLFDEKYTFCGNPFSFFEKCVRNDNKTGQKLESYVDYININPAAYMSIMAVLEGTDKALENNMIHYAFPEVYGEFGRNVLKMAKDLRHLLYKYSICGHENLLDDISSLSKKKSTEVNEENSILHKTVLMLSVVDMWPFIVQTISEIIDKPFWELWNKAKESVSLDIGVKPVLDVSTQEFFDINADDMISLWTPESSGIKFSPELMAQFEHWKGKYDEVVLSKEGMSDPFNQIFDSMVFASREYFRIYTDKNFFEETLANLMDIRYQALWMIYDEMLHNPEMLADGGVVFTEKELSEKERSCYQYECPPRRGLVENWFYMPYEKKFNKARVTLRRYMALLANKELRFKVFGI